MLRITCAAAVSWSAAWRAPLACRHAGVTCLRLLMVCRAPCCMPLTIKPLKTHLQAVETGGSKRMAAAAGQLGSRAAAAAKDGATWALLLKILLVSLLRRFQPKAVSSFELLCLAVPLPDVMARWMVSHGNLHSPDVHIGLPVSACVTQREVWQEMSVKSFVDAHVQFYNTSFWKGPSLLQPASSVVSEPRIAIWTQCRAGRPCQTASRSACNLQPGI